MSYFSVNITNRSTVDSVTVSPVNGSGFGCCVPPRGRMNFSFQSVGGSDSITLALVLLSDHANEPAQIIDIQTNGGMNSLKEGDGTRILMDITNLDDRSVTDVEVGSPNQAYVPAKVAGRAGESGTDEISRKPVDHSFEDIPPMIVN
jgi:hypothetical protein